MTLSTRLFDSARTKLTASYVLILFLIIALFSLLLYQGAKMELRRSLRTQALRFVPRYDRLVPMSIVNEPDEEVFAAARNRLLARLLVVDAVIFVGASVAAYILAGATLRPIEEAMTRQKQFVSDASHELRTPLTAMQTEIEVFLLQKKWDEDGARQILKSNLEEIGKMRELSNYLLRLSTLEKSDHPLKLQPVDLTQILHGAVKNTMHLAAKKSISVDTSALVATYNTIGNATALREVFTILLDNAIKYSHNGGVVRIGVTTNKKECIVAISDSGIGISPSELPYIFNRFFRAERSRSKQHVNGYGLGLAIAKTIIGQHHGRILAESMVGQGSTFRVHLPTRSFSELSD